MGLVEWLRTLAEALPEGASITFSSEALRSLAADGRRRGQHLGTLVEEVVNHLDRSPQTVRRWIREGELSSMLTPSEAASTALRPPLCGTSLHGSRRLRSGHHNRQARQSATRFAWQLGQK